MVDVDHDHDDGDGDGDGNSYDDQDIEIILGPNLHSDLPHEILGVGRHSDEEALDRAYRDLARKYHPFKEENENDDEKDRSFQKIAQAYAYLTSNGRNGSPQTREEAQQAYEAKFGKYRELYYSEAGLLGMPYASDLNDIWQRPSSQKWRNRLAVEFQSSSSAASFPSSRTSGRIVRFCFGRTWLLKKDMNLFLCLSEILLTWTVLAFCVMSFLVYTNPDVWPAGAQNDGQIINIVGGVALLFAQFIVAFWYGHTHFPAGGNNFLDWMYGTTKRTVEEQDMEDIRDVCSQYLHQDKEQRFNAGIVVACFPIVILDQTAAWITSVIARVFLAAFRTHDVESRAYTLAVFKCIGALGVVVGYYILWMYGNVYCKLGGTVALLLEQKLYGAILFKMGPFEFFQTLLFGNVLLVTVSKAEDSKRQYFARAKELEAAMDGESGFSGDDESGEDLKGSSTDDRSGSAQTPNGILTVKRKSSSYGKRVGWTPDTVDDGESLDGSMELSYVEKHGSATIATIENGGANESAEQNKNSTIDSSIADRGVAAGAAQILEDLDNGKEKDEDDDAAYMLAKFKATKRRLEEAYFSSRSGNSAIIGGRDFTNRSSDWTMITPESSRIGGLSSAYSVSHRNSSKGKLIRPLTVNDSTEESSLNLLNTVEVFQDGDTAVCSTRSLDGGHVFEEKKDDGMEGSHVVRVTPIDGRDLSPPPPVQHIYTDNLKIDNPEPDNAWNRTSSWAGNIRRSLSLSPSRNSAFGGRLGRSRTEQNKTRHRKGEDEDPLEMCQIVRIHNDNESDAESDDQSRSGDSGMARDDEPIEVCCAPDFVLK